MKRETNCTSICKMGALKFCSESWALLRFPVPALAAYEGAQACLALCPACPLACVPGAALLWSGGFPNRCIFLVPGADGSIRLQSKVGRRMWAGGGALGPKSIWMGMCKIRKAGRLQLAAEGQRQSRVAGYLANSHTELRTKAPLSACSLPSF